MESHRGKSIPVVKDFNGEEFWTPETPVKPNVARQSPIYDDGQSGLLAQAWGEREAYLSRYTQNNEAQTLLSGNYPTTTHNIWDGSHGIPSLLGNSELQRENVEIHRRDFEGYLPHWSSEGRRSVMSYGSSNLASVSYPMFNSWDMTPPRKNVVCETGSIFGQNFTDADLGTMSFKDLLRNNGGMTPNDIFLPNWDSQIEINRLNTTPQLNNQEAFRGINPQMNSLYSQAMHNDALPSPFWSTSDLNSFPSDKQVNGNSAFAPATPDSWQRLQSNVASNKTPPDNNQQPSEQNVLQEHEVHNQNQNISGPILDSTPNKISLAIEEDHNPDKGVNQGIDLSDTPQKKPRRRRYTPKVIREKKPKSTPKPKTPTPIETQGKRNYVRKNKTNAPTPTRGEETEPNPTEIQGKRNYVRKNKTNTPTPPRGEETEPNPTETKPDEPPVKSCKKTLNFDLNGDLGEEPQASECQETDNQSRHPVVMQAEELIKTSMTAYDLNITQKEELREYMSLPVKENIDSSETDINISLGEKIKSPDNTTRKDSCFAQSPNSSPCGSSSEGADTRGSKRGFPYTAEHTVNDVEINTIIQYSPWETNHTSKRAEKIRRVEDIIQVGKGKNHAQAEITPSNIQRFEDISQVGKDDNHAQVEHTASKYYCCNANTPVGISGVTSKHAELVKKSEDRNQLTKTWADLSRLKKKNTTKAPTRVQNLVPLSEIASASKDAQRKKVNCGGGSHPCHEMLNGVPSSTEILALDTNTTPKPKRRSKNQDSVTRNWNIVPYGGIPPARKATGSSRTQPWKKRRCSIEKLTQLFQELDINKEKSKVSRKKQNKAIVPYRGNKQQQNALVLYNKDGSMVPFEGPFNPISKRRQRARVDLDDETTRVWRLLLENIDNEGINGTDEDKAKWWENERRVFRGRVDSFIARMRLVQGDRRFTPWKGSVLDSVIGVFLTQNVSDHLSSSAFMSMAARFPLKPESSGSTLSEEATSTLFGEPEICIIEPEESITWNEKINDQPTLDMNSRAIFYFEPSEEKEVVNSSETCQRDDATSSQQSVISSQNSINSPKQRSGRMLNTFSENSKFSCLDHTSSFMGLLQMAERNIHHQSNSQTLVQNHLEGFKYDYRLNQEAGFHLQDTQGLDMLEVESRSSDMSRKDENSPTTEQSNLTSEITDQAKSPDRLPRDSKNKSSYYILEGQTMIVQSHMQEIKDQQNTIALAFHEEIRPTFKGSNVPVLSQQMADVIESTRELERTRNKSKEAEQIYENNYTSGMVPDMANTNPSKTAKGKAGKGKKNEFDWDSLRREAQVDGKKPERPANTRDSLDWEAVLHAKASDIADTIKERGMNNVLAGRIKDLLDRLVKDHGSIDMEWVRDIPPDKAKEYLLSFRGLGLKSVECVRLLTLHHLAFPVDTNVGRIAVRLGWVPLQPLPESLQLHLLEMYPILESIQQYLWPRLCKLDQKTLYELHYHMITFGKVFCTKRQPNCNACPLRGECRHFASAFASARFALPGPEERSIMPASGSSTPHENPRAATNLLPSTSSWNSQNPHSNSESWHHSSAIVNNHNPHSNSEIWNQFSAIVQGASFPLSPPLPQTVHLERKTINSQCEPIVEVPASPEQEPQHEQALCDIEDAFYDDPNEIPTINLNMKEFTETLQNFMLQEAGMSNALVALTAEAASIPTPKLKNINRLRTEHHVYELPDTHPLLQGLEKREPDDPCSYLLAIWTPGETANSIDPPERRCCFDDPSMLCNEETCSYCSSQRETDSQIVRGTLLIPTRTAMRGSFPLNGTYFQVNEVFADHDSSLNPIAVPRSWLWNLPRRTVYFGTSIPSIFKGLNTEDIQHCFWRGYVCVRGFDQKTRAPRPLLARLHFPASRLVTGGKGKAYDE